MSRIEKALEKAAQKRTSAVEIKEPISSIEGAERLLASPDCLTAATPLDIDNPLLVSMREKKDAISEEYSKLRSRVLHLTKGDEFRNALMVTSSMSEEGKTLTALNLAIAIAKEYDHTVLLVDTDLRRPSIHKYLGIEPKAGLIQYLKDQCKLTDVLIKTGIGKLVVLPAGGVLDDPVEVLSSNRMKEVVQELKGRYPDRYVIFDTPPMLPFADAQVLKEHLDGTIFVVRERKVQIEHVKKVISTINDQKLLGIVYNDMQSQSATTSYSYY